MGDIRSGELESIEYFYELVAQLKKIKRKLLTNCYLSQDKLMESIQRQEIVFEYSHNKYLNIFVDDDGFKRLYYYIADIDNYIVEDQEGKIVCDIFQNGMNEESERVINTLIKCGFNQYACFNKWVKQIKSIEPYEERADVCIRNTFDEEVIGWLYENFNRYTDCLPRKTEVDDFIKNMQFTCAYDTTTGKLVGSLICSKKRKACITEEYLFVDMSERGRGISNSLYEYCYHRYSNIGYKYNAWIRNDNVPCIVLHERLDYSLDEMKKITFLKG